VQVTSTVIAILTVSFALQAYWPDVIGPGFALSRANPGFPGVMTYMLLHANIWHLLGNMIALYRIGSDAERLVSPAAYLSIFITGGVVAALSEAFAYRQFGAVLETYGVGASGAITALGGFVLIWAPATLRLHLEDPVLATPSNIKPILWQMQFGIWLIGLLLADLAFAHETDHNTYLQYGRMVFAHLGGWVFGALVAIGFRFTPHGRYEYKISVGVQLFLAGHWWEALEHFQRLNSRYPEDPDIVRWEARCLQMTGQTNDCYRCLDNAIHLYRARGQEAEAAAVSTERARVVSIFPSILAH
jgi:membrane associated rhomboid family serine protease